MKISLVGWGEELDGIRELIRPTDFLVDGFSLSNSTEDLEVRYHCLAPLGHLLGLYIQYQA